MGQINSTRNSGHSNSESETESGQPSADATITSTSTRDNARLSAGRDSRRKSMRDSIVDFLHTRHSKGIEADGIQDAVGSRRWWRWKGRFSKIRVARQAESQEIRSGERSSSPPQTHNGGEISSQTNSPRWIVNSTHQVPASSQCSRERSDATPEAHSSNLAEAPDNNHGAFSREKGKSKGKERSVEKANNLIDRSVETSTSSSIDSMASGRGAVPPVNVVSDVTSRAPLQALGGGQRDTAPSSPLPSHSTVQPSTNGNPLRRFPPPGTLVVVQGVVRTDNVPSLAQDSPPFFDSGLSSVSSSSATRPNGPVLPFTDQNVTTVGGAPRPSQSPSDGSEGTSRRQLFESLSNSSTASTTEVGVNAPSRESSSSPNGADVLGALLSVVSVATAATAASLLSASSEPTIPAPSNSLHTPPSTSSPSSQGSSGVPLVARALASANPAAAAVLAQREREREREERERTRPHSIWDGLRDRLSASRGRRSSSGIESHSHASALSSDDNRTSSTSLAPESLFSELVRAFNLGSQEDERSSDARSAGGTGRERQESSPGRGVPAGDTEESPPGSFDRFLVDLQSDLRLALTRPSPTTNPGRYRDHRESESSRLAPENANSLVPGNSTVADSTVTRHLVDPVSWQFDDHRESRESGSRNVDGATRSPSPLLVNNNDASDGETRPHARDSEAIPGTAFAVNQNSPAREGNGSPTSGNTPRSGVNWWRMYRFPPTLPGQSRHEALPFDDAGGPTASPSVTDARRVEPTVQSDSTPRTDATGQEASGVLVPVIVVGLQSISSRARQPHLPTSSRPSEDGGIADDVHESARRMEDSQLSDSYNPTGPQHAHDTWSSRAVHAFSRMGRRDTATGQDHESLHPIGGSRMFLIYVIGGHYPPGHQILSGPEATNSFEALWDLVDFLGQIKPPVVTEEEIERSGLELFKASALEQYVITDNVASNCLDRCLICLNDYGSSDDLRLLTCKHTFHKACVDKWLKTGRNNCPVCRSEGVKTGNNTFPSPR